MSGGYFPASQKIASITPILKKASLDPLDLGNYRPILNLTFLSKLLERAAYEQIVGYMECHHLLPPLQSAYQKHRSTETATIKVMSDIYRAADAGLVTLLGLLDLSAAFNTVDHVILLVRLQHLYGISGFALRWIESYLTGRSQFVRFNGETSVTTMVTFRCPSGIGAWPDPLYCILCRSHWHRGAARLQRARFCRWLTGLRACCAARSCSPGHADVHVHRKRQGLDEFQPTSSQPFEDGADMVGLQPSSAPLQQYQNEGVGRRPSTRWLCPRSGSPHRQWDDAGETRQPHFECLLIPAPTITNHPSIPHLGCCSCSGTRTHTYAYRLLQRAPRVLVRVIWLINYR